MDPVKGDVADERDAHGQAAGADGQLTSPRVSQRRWWTHSYAVLAVVMVSIAALLGFGLGRDPRAIDSPLLHRQAPDFNLKTLTGERIGLSDLRGHPIVLNFWASWCVACRVEHPALTAAWQRWGNQGVVFLGIVYQDSPAAAREFVQGLGGAWPSLIDPGGRVALDYGVSGVPETFFIAPDGSIVFKRTGGSTFVLLEHWINRMLSGPSRPRNGAP